MTIAMAAMVAGISALTASQSGLERIEQKIPGQLPSFWMVKVPGGTVEIGGKSVEVKPLWVAETELTWDVYDIYAFRLDLSREEQAQGVDAQSRPSKPYGAPDRGYGHQGFAALGMTDNAAEHFCQWLSKKTGKSFRLPTEAEWEYAARAGAKSEPEPVGDFAWTADNSDDAAHHVAKKKANAWGLYDMLGNIAEWVVRSDGVKVVAGGSFVDKVGDVKFGSREPFNPMWQDADAHVPKSKWWLSDGIYVGMRVVCEP